MDPADLTPWQRGDKFAASHLNEVVSYLQANGNVTGEEGLTGDGPMIYSGSNGTVIRKGTKNFTGRWFWGKILRSNLPADQTDYTDERYWVQCQEMGASGDNTKVPEFAKAKSVLGLVEDADASELVFINTVMAINVAESHDHSHTIVEGQIVRVWETREQGTYYNSDNGGPKPLTSMTRWVFYRPQTGLFRVKLTQTGGTAGSSTVACSFTYDVIDYYDDTITIDTDIEVEKDRLLVCAMNAADKGWAYYDKDGNLKIWDCNETAQTQAC